MYLLTVASSKIISKKLTYVDSKLIQYHAFTLSTKR